MLDGLSRAVPFRAKSHAHGRGRHNGSTFEQESRPRAPGRGDGYVGDAAKLPKMPDAQAECARGTLLEPLNAARGVGMGNGPRARPRRARKLRRY